MASTSNLRPILPQLDLVAIAKTTRKTLDRLASFSHMQSASESSTLLTKILDKINGLVHHIDSSMLAAQMGYQLATNAMILCDSEDADWEADVTRESLRDLSSKAQELSQSVMEAFRDIKQEVYKIAASTKDNMLVLVVPPDPTHAETMRIHLKDVGTGLVANLTLLSEYSRCMTSVAEWWKVVKEDLVSAEPSMLPPPPDTASNATQDDDHMNEGTDHLTRWLEIKQTFQDYYDVINYVHVRYPDLLATSSAAWQSVAYARSTTPSSAGQSETNFPKLQTPDGSVAGHTSSEPKKQKGALARIFAFRRKTLSDRANEKGKAKESAHEREKAKKENDSGHPEEGASRPDSRSSPASTPSHSGSTRSVRSTRGDDTRRNSRTSLSLGCSAIIFHGALRRLGCHGLVL